MARDSKGMDSGEGADERGAAVGSNANEGRQDHHSKSKVSHLSRQKQKEITNYWKLAAFIFLALLVISIFTSGFRSILGMAGGVNTLKSSQEFRLDNAYATGSKDAPVTIIEYSDFQCPYCGNFYDNTLPKIQQNYISTGKVRFVFKDFPLSFHRNAMNGAEAARCAGEQGKFFAMHDLLFANQGQWENLADPLSVFMQYAGRLNLSTEKFQTCYNSRKYETQIREDIIEGTQKGVTGTPTFFINGQKIVGAQPYKVFERVINAALRGEKVSNSTEGQNGSQQLENSISAENISLSSNGNAVLGNESAHITIYEFSDYQCPYCRKYYVETSPQIVSNYVDTGKAKVVFIDFPLSSLHPSAEMSAEAAECSRDQGNGSMYWKVHDAIFNAQEQKGTGTVPYSESQLMGWLSAVPGLNITLLKNCTDSGKYSQEVAGDFAMGRAAGVSGTPTFFIMTKSSNADIQKLLGMQQTDGQGGYFIRAVYDTAGGQFGLKIVGAQPYSAFENALNAELGE